MKYLLGMLGVVGALLSGDLAAQSIQTGSPNTAAGPVYREADRAKLATQPAIGSSVAVEGEIAPVETAVLCAQCWTCGGTWPIFAGSFSIPLPATGSNVSERGPSCAGAPGDIASGGRNRDGSPFLCCR
jgi:hypothetical protein